MKVSNLRETVSSKKSIKLVTCLLSGPIGPLVLSTGPMGPPELLGPMGPLSLVR